VSDTTKVK